MKRGDAGTLQSAVRSAPHLRVAVRVRRQLAALEAAAAGTDLRAAACGHRAPAMRSCAFPGRQSYAAKGRPVKMLNHSPVFCASVTGLQARAPQTSHHIRAAADCGYRRRSLELAWGHPAWRRRRTDRCRCEWRRIASVHQCDPSVPRRTDQSPAVTRRRLATRLQLRLQDGPGTRGRGRRAPVPPGQSKRVRRRDDGNQIAELRVMPIYRCVGGRRRSGR